jgi:putative transcriptional regulator
MSEQTAALNLTHHFLIAMPNVVGQVFEHSLVYLCQHNANGAMGLIINKPTDLKCADLFQKVDLHLSRLDLQQQPVFHGGPVQTDRGFVLHTAMMSPSKYPADADDHAVDQPTGMTTGEAVYNMSIDAGLGLQLTTSRDVLDALSIGAGPDHVLITLGCASWAPGQLESELAENSWLTAPAEVSLMFDVPVDQRYAQSLSSLGLEPWMLNTPAGRA